MVELSGDEDDIETTVSEVESRLYWKAATS